MATDVTFYFLRGEPWWATGPRIQGYVELSHPAAGTGPKYEVPDGLHKVPQGWGVYEFEMSVEEARQALLACGHEERVAPGEAEARAAEDPYRCTPDECKMMATHVPECWARAGERRAARDAERKRARQAELDEAKAEGLERAIAILRESNDTCDDFYHNGCGCQDHLVHSMDLEARALRGEEF